MIGNIHLPSKRWLLFTLFITFEGGGNFDLWGLGLCCDEDKESVCEFIDMGTLCRLWDNEFISSGIFCRLCASEVKSILALLFCVNAVKSIPPSTPVLKLEFWVKDDTNASTAAEDADETDMELDKDEETIWWPPNGPDDKWLVKEDAPIWLDKDCLDAEPIYNKKWI